MKAKTVFAGKQTRIIQRNHTRNKTTLGLNLLLHTFKNKQELDFSKILGEVETKKQQKRTLEKNYEQDLQY